MKLIDYVEYEGCVFVVTNPQRRIYCLLANCSPTMPPATADKKP